jgi:putative transposase
MDSLSLKRVGKLTEKMVKARNAGDLAEAERLHREAEKAGKGLVFTSYQQAIEWLEATIDRYNDKPHSSLPKIADPQTGKPRHQTPREALQAHMDAGWEPVALDEEHLVDLFRLHVRCTVTREAISPIGNGQRYHMPGMGAWNGQEVLASVDPMEWRSVIVKTLEGEVLGTAELVNVVKGYRAKSQYELAEEKRANAQINNKQKGITQIRARSGRQIAAPASSTVVIAGKVIDTREAITRAPVTLDAQPAPVSVPTSPAPAQTAPAAPAMRPRSEMSHAELLADWERINSLIASGESVSEQEGFWHQSFQRHPVWKTWAKDSRVTPAERRAVA